MNASAHHSNRYAEAAREIAHRAVEAQHAPTTEAARQALLAVRDACVRAAEVLNTVERETREPAIAQVERAA